MKQLKYQLTLLLLPVFFLACGDEEQAREEISNSRIEGTASDDRSEHILDIKITPVEGTRKWGDSLGISVADSHLSPEDSVELRVNDETISVLTLNSPELTLSTSEGFRVGENELKISLAKEGQTYTERTEVFLLSDSEPEDYTYKVRKTYRHDAAAYTQGLFFRDGNLYEATGLKGASSIRKVNPQTGEVLQSFAVAEHIFGEGITYFDNKIIQLSWQAEKGYVYDYQTFAPISEFAYSGEGWGLCNDEQYLYMTDGSHRIKVLDPQSFAVLKTINVCDDKGRVKYLNETEYFDGAIYANIYQYDKIAKIDPKTGKVLAYINLKGLLPASDYLPETDVLNGIAYDKVGDRIFVTGKNWPKLFEVKFVKKK